MRNISFSLTTPQVRARETDVTRRMGWRNAKVGERVWACVKCMGLKPGEQIERICQIEWVSVTFEPLDRLADDSTPEAVAYGLSEVRREGFPTWSPDDFIAMFLRSHKGCELETEITRLEFCYVD